MISVAWENIRKKGCVCITTKRLKLYDTIIEICISKKNKEKLRKIAYKNNITMSECIRRLIDFAIANNDFNISKCKNDMSSKNFDDTLSLLGGIFNE